MKIKIVMYIFKIKVFFLNNILCYGLFILKLIMDFGGNMFINENVFFERIEYYFVVIF